MVSHVKLAAFLIASAVMATPSAAAGEEKVKDPDKIVCKTEQFVGSHRTRRICLTRQQWDDIREGSQKVLQDRVGKLPYDRPTAGQGG